MENQLLSYDYSFIKKLNKDIYIRFKDLINVSLLADESSFTFVSNSSSMFEIGLKYYISELGTLQQLCKSNNPNLFEILSSDVFFHLEQHLPIDYNIVQKCRIIANSNKHDINLINYNLSKFIILKNIFYLYVYIYRELYVDEIDMPTDDYINSLIDDFSNIEKKYNEKKNELSIIDKNIHNNLDLLQTIKDDVEKNQNILKSVIKDVEQSKNEKIEVDKTNINKLFELAQEHLENNNYEAALVIYQRIISLNHIDYRAYIGVFLSRLHITNIDEVIENPKVDIIFLDEYQQAIKLLVGEDLERVKSFGENIHNEYIYSYGLNFYNSQNFKQAIPYFEQIIGYKDSVKLLEICKDGIIYNEARDLFRSCNFEEALKKFEQVKLFDDVNNYLMICKDKIQEKQVYDNISKKKLIAFNYMNSNSYEMAYKIYDEINDVEKKELALKLKETFNIFQKYIDYKASYEDLMEIDNKYKLVITFIRRYPNFKNERFSNIEQYYDDLFYKKNIKFTDEFIKVFNNTDPEEKNFIVNLLNRFIYIYIKNEIMYFIDQDFIEYIKRNNCLINENLNLLNILGVL